MKVSVLLVSKDRPKYLERAVRALLEHDYPDFEVVVQDGSVDTDAPNVPYDDPRLYYWRAQDKSIANGLNMAAERATGEVFHFACDDDVMLPGAMVSAVSALQAGVEWTYGAMNILDEYGTFLETNGGWPWDAYRMEHDINIVPQPTTFFTRRVWNMCGPFNEDFPLCFDYEMWGRIGSRWEPTVRQHFDADYTRWAGSTSVNNQAAQWEEVWRIKAMWREYGFGRRPYD